MRTLLLATAILCTGLSAQSQILSKGQRLINSNFQLSSITFETSTDPAGTAGVIKFRSNNYSFQPGFAISYRKNSVAGVFLHIGHFEAVGKNSDRITSQTDYRYAGPGLYYEKYFNLGERIFISADGKLRATYGVANTYWPPSHSKSRRFESVFTVTPHLGYKISPRFLIEVNPGELFQARYDYERIKNDADWAMGKTYTKSRTAFTSRFLDNCPSPAFGVGFRYIIK